MPNYIIGSARSDENGKYTRGKAGDQKNGKEVSTQSFYVHKLGWYVLRLKDNAKAEKLGNAMQRACNNNNIGYNQAQRLDIISKGIGTTKPTNCDCSSLVRACLIHIGINVDNFTTSNETTVLLSTGLFEKITYNNQVPLYKGDILVTKKQGHTAIVTQSDIIKSSKTKAIAIPTLKKGCKGHTVSLLQSNLIELCGANIKRDSMFGPETEKAVIALQKTFWPKNREEWDGIYGKKTYQAMQFVAACKGYEVL